MGTGLRIGARNNDSEICFNDPTLFSSGTRRRRP